MKTVTSKSEVQLDQPEEDRFVSFDLHYHTNIYRLSKKQRDLRLSQHRQCLSETNVDYVASTEHGYKSPLDAYLYLRDATEGIHTTILPAVEAISKEGVDIIFIFQNESDLRRGLRDLPAFNWSVDDMRHLRDATGSISIIPHPFTPGKTGLANAVGAQRFMNLQEDVDYVEIHNGLSLHFLENGLKDGKLTAPLPLQKKVNHTYRLPNEFRLDHVGWAVSSDAHFPQHQSIVGSVKYDAKDSAIPNDWFSYLKKRHKFQKKEVREQNKRQWMNVWHMLQSGYCTMEEAIEKRAQKSGILREASLKHPDAA